MKLRRKVVAILLIGTMVVCGETRQAQAQDAPPDFRMLLNLDLFEPRPSDEAKSAAAPAASATDDSMLDQIRTLDAMGYLGNHKGDGNGTNASRMAVQAPESAPHPRESAGVPRQSDVSAPVEAPIPASQPSYDVEGPQP
jgi:hypothetical protein